MSEKILDSLLSKYYTTEQVAQAVGRKTGHWCRIRHRYIAKFNLKCVKIGRRHYYEKALVNNMIEQLLQEGD